MSKLKKLLLGAVIGLLAVIIIAVIVVGLFLGKIVTAGINTVGPKITQTTLTVDTVDLSLLTGSATVKNLVVGSPEGYKAPNAISLGLTAVSVAPMSVLSDKIVVKSLRLESPEITFEGNPFGGNNLKKLEANVDSAAASLQSPSTNQPANTAAPAKPGKKLEVDDILITGAKVHFNGVTLPTLPDIHLSNLGKGPEGITAAELTKDVLAQVTDETLKAVAKDAANLGKDAGKAVGAGVNKITTGIGGLIKKATN